MLPRTHRFHGYNSLRFVYSHGTTVRGPLFSVRSVSNPRRNEYRVAIIVSRKVHKSAVARNKMRRRLYAAVRNLETQITRPYDIVVTVFSELVLEESAKSLEEQLKKLFAQSGIT